MGEVVSKSANKKRIVERMRKEEGDRRQEVRGYALRDNRLASTQSQSKGNGVEANEWPDTGT